MSAIRRRGPHLCAACALASALASVPSARAEEAPPEGARAFTGRAVYVGGGIASLPTVSEAASTLRIAVVFPLGARFAIEPQGFLLRTAADTHHGGREGATGAGFALGLRVAPFPDARVRPYVAARLAHLHFWPDPWGDHDGSEAGVDGHTSHHRFGLGGALGFDAQVAGPLRLGIEGDALAFGGPGPNASLAAQGVVGVAF